MSYQRQYLSLDDKAILAQCTVQTYKASGPGGQHRNKTLSAVRLKHVPTGITAQSEGSRVQHENKRLAVNRLRMNIACRLREPVDVHQAELPEFVSECIFRPRGRSAEGACRLEVGRKDRRFWQVGAFLLDLLETFEGRMAPAAVQLGITTGNLARVLKSDRHLFGAAQVLRKRFGRKPLD